MSGPQSLSPEPVVPSRPRKRFTLAEANKSLPLVQRIVQDIVQSHEAVTRTQVACETGDARLQREAQGELRRSMEALQGYVEELESLGIELKDFESGLIDFVARHEDRDIYLCWRLGESAVGHWHELNTGFAGRRPVSELNSKP